MAENWTTIESDPGVFSELIQKIGVRGLEVEELYTLDRATFEQIRFEAKQNRKEKKKKKNKAGRAKFMKSEIDKLNANEMKSHNYQKAKQQNKTKQKKKIDFEMILVIYIFSWFFFFFYLSSPCYGLIFLFKWNSDDKDSRKALDHYDPGDIFFANQVMRK